MLSLPIPTDNLYKFACLFGLTLIVVAVAGIVAMTTTEVDRTVRMMEAVHLAQVKQDPVAAEGAMALYKGVHEVTKLPFAIAMLVLNLTLGAGALISVVGAMLWKKKVQMRDDTMAELQLEKLQLEVAALRRQEAAGSAKV